MAFVWDDEDRSQAEMVKALANQLQPAAGAWSSALHVRGMHVLYAGARTGSSEIYRLNGVDGVVLGTAFEACTHQAQSTLAKKFFSNDESRQILASGCRSLVTCCWGRYVAFARDEAANRAYVVRDPTGGLPCYRTVFRGVEVYFSDVEDVVGLGVLQFNIDWDFIAARAVSVFVHARETALAEVTEVLAGERLQIEPGSTVRMFAWNPLHIAQTDIIEDVEIAARELRRVATACIHSWASCYDNILHKLSGGLDSSIVLACLRSAPSRPTVTCLNYYSTDSNGDERFFARLAAKQAGVSLLEWERSNSVRLEDLLQIRRSVAPTYYLGPLQTSRVEASWTREIGTGAYFGGAGGDQLFYPAQGVLAAADYLRLHGLNRRFFEIALDAAHLDHCSIWHVIRDAYKKRRAVSPRNAQRNTAASRSLLTDGAVSRTLEHGGFTHPLFGSADSMPPGKLWHAYGLTLPREYYDPLGAADDPEHVEPLLAQPLVELCLRIPTYVLTHAGWDRALARHAFRADLPREILRRRSKGGMEEHAQEILMRNLATARELLLEGQLMKAGLLDRARVTEVLSDRPTPIPGAAAEVFDYLSIEIWLRAWSSPDAR
jgi:asparagine synthase (glutamine-hydrolysing)